MTRRPLIIPFAAAILFAGPAIGRGQPGEPPTTYKLNRHSTYQYGCFPPCLCPIMDQAPLVGTFDLVFDRFDGLFWHYDVTVMNWTALHGAPGLPVSGSGTYRVGGEFASMHQLELDLVVGSEPVQHFDSGLVVGGHNFPTMDIVVSVNGIWCLDTVLEVFANPLGDIDGDGDVDRADLDLFVEVLLGTDVDPDHVDAADLNIDGRADGRDVTIFVDVLVGP